MTVAGGSQLRKRTRSPRARGLERAALAAKPSSAGADKQRSRQARPDPAALLAWYDRHRRRLPWRAAAGQAPDPYRVWLSEVMLQQTTVRSVTPYFLRFIERWPTIAALAAAPLGDVLKAWAGLGYYARARNLHACARAIVERHGGRFPASEDELRALPGIGAYTAAAIAAIAFDRRAAPVDGNVERVIARLYAVEDEARQAKLLIRLLVKGLVPATRCGDFAQAMMDLGATLCTPKKPACAICPWSGPCVARQRGDPEAFPRRVRKREGKPRRGAAFWVTRGDGFVLVRRRPTNGLLGGMTEVPTTAWTHDFDDTRALADAPLRAKWRRLTGTVTHTFTHFLLELAVYAAKASPGTPAPAGTRWLALGELADEAFPSLMRKVIAHALAR
jgi:A/G-specific adenine glycosylase